MIWPIRRVISHMYQKPRATIAARISRKPLKAAARSQSAHTVVGSALRQRSGKRAAIGPAMYVQKKFVHIEPSQRHCTDAGRLLAKDSERIYNWGYGCFLESSTHFTSYGVYQHSLLSGTNRRSLLDYAPGVAAFAARRLSRNRRTALTRNHKPGMITINQGMIAATAVMSAAKLSPRSDPKFRSASPTDANAPRLIVRCSAWNAISTYTFSVSLARILRCVASLSSSA